MTRLAKTFESLKSQNKKALIPYITAGDPLADGTVAIMHSLVKAGASILELGVPFSDPAAEGPVIQAAHERALANGVTLKKVLADVATFRQQDQDTPIVLMGYLNPIEHMGYAAFAKAAAQAGVDGCIIVDLPYEESRDLCDELRTNAIDLIFLIAPTSSDERIKHMCEAASGFLYYVSFKGVTGAGRLDVSAAKQRVEHLRELSGLPIAVGFGIRDPASAAAVAQFADAVVVGSALIAKLAELSNPTTEQCNQTAMAFITSLSAVI